MKQVSYAFKPPATLPGFFPSVEADPVFTSASSPSRTSLECCFDSSEVSKIVSQKDSQLGNNYILGLLRFALWPPTTFPRLDILITIDKKRFPYCV